MSIKTRIRELASQVGTLFVVSVFVAYYWKLIADHTAIIDWQAAILITLGLMIFWLIARLIKHRVNQA